MNKILDFYTRYMALWVVLGAIAAYIKPEPFVSMKGFMDTFFGITMFGIGVTLRYEDFKSIITRPGIVALGAICQFTIMPFGAFLVSRALGLPPEISLGLIIAGSAPGAMASNVMSYIAGADVAYSVSLTSVSTIITPVMTPALIYLLAHSVIKVDFFNMFIALCKMVILPLFLGFMIRRLFSSVIEKIQFIFPAISSTFIIFICSLVVALNRNSLYRITWLIAAGVIILNIGGMLMGYSMARAAAMGIKKRRTLSIEIGMQNAGLGTVLALKYFSAKTAIPTAAFVFVCIFTASIAAQVWRSMDNSRFRVSQ